MVAIKMQSEEEGGKTSPLFHFSSRRFHMILLISLGFCGTTYMRTNIALAMTCMVNSTAVHMLQTEMIDVTSTAFPLTLLNQTRDEEISSQPQCQKKNTVGGHVVVDYGGSLVWDATVQNFLFSGTFWGALVVMIPSIFLMNRCSPRLILLAAVLIYSVCTVVMPFASVYLGFQYVFVSRVIMGLGEAVVIPSINALITNWFPVVERSTAVAIFISGLAVSMAGGNVIAAALCNSRWGWPAIFYGSAGYGILWSIGWYFLASSRPSKCKGISVREQDYLAKTVPERTTQQMKSDKVPYMSVIKSKPFWAQAVGQFSLNFFATFMQVYLPSYFKEVLYLDVVTNGFFVAFPNILSTTVNLIYSIGLDKLKQKGIVGMTFSCKLSQCGANFGTGICMLAVAYWGNCANPYTVLFIISVNFLFMGMFTCGAVTSLLLLAPKYTGTLSSATMFIGMIGRILAPIAVGLLKTTGTVEEWQHIFILAAVVSIASGITFGVWGSGEAQPWGEDQSPVAEELKELKTPEKTLPSLLLQKQIFTASTMSIEALTT